MSRYLSGGPNNRQRAAWAEEVVKTFQGLTGSDRDNAIADLIADLCHLGAQWRQKPLIQVVRGVTMYIDERDYPPDGWPPSDKPAKVKLVTARRGQPTLVYDIGVRR